MRGKPPLRWHGLVFGVALIAPLMTMDVRDQDYSRDPIPATPTSQLVERAEQLSTRLDSLVAEYQKDALPIERALYSYRADSTLVRRVTYALVRHARGNGLDPHLLAGVLLVENPWLKPDTASFVGATGLMQVMPFHAGQWGCGSDDLTDVETNICHGARILAWNLNEANGNMRKALLRYNGCVSGTNTPDCHRYPDHVMRAVRRVRAHAAPVVMHAMLGD